MSKKTSPTNICIYFGLSKGEGEWPDLDVLTSKEKQDPRTFCDFNLDLDEGGSSINPKIIKSCKVIYDGVSTLPAFNNDDLEYGIHIKKGEVYGNIRPIIEFELTQEVDHAEFTRLVWGSSYVLSPQNAEEPFYAEDWNGYTEVLSEQRKQEWEAHLKSNNVYSGKVFKPKDLQEGISSKKLRDSVDKKCFEIS